MGTALAFKMDKEVRLLSRNRTLFNDNYPRLVDALKSLKTRKFIIDGEIPALDEKGRSSFQLLQSYGVRKGIPLVYYAFDLLSVEGTDLRSRPLVERRELLAKLLKKLHPISASPRSSVAQKKSFCSRRGNSSSKA